MKDKNKFDKLQQEQRDLDASYRQSLQNKKERESMEVKDIMKRLNNLANAVHNAVDPGMKQIWTDKWYALVKQYANTIEKQKENVK